MPVQPFTISIADEVLRDLHERLDRTRWPDALAGVGWDYGTDPDVLRDWCERWRRFDWRAQERRLNAVPQFTFPTDGVDLHFAHLKPDGADAAPLVLLNGWPATFAELLGLAERLSRPSDGGRVFEVIVPSLPGYGFSSRPAETGWDVGRMAGAVLALMSELGHERFAAHGSDIGGGVVLAMAAMAPERLICTHGLNVYWGYPHPEEPSEAEKAYLQRTQEWRMAEGGYAMEQASKPQTLAVGLNDSPAGLAAWVLEKWRGWSDRGLDAFDPDDVLTNLTIYWTTQTIGSSVRVYKEMAAGGGRMGRSEVPAGVLVTPGDILPAPRDWGERWLNLVRWTEADRGGHFPALDVPDLLAAEIRATVDAAEG